MHITSENTECCIVTIFIHNVCNYNCSYCSDYHRDGSTRWPKDWSPYLNFFNELKKRNKYLYVDILGGEPTVWPQFQEFVDTIVDDNTFVEVSSNASRTLRYWEEFDTPNIFLLFSWHYEEADDDHFFKVCEIMQHKASVSVPMLITPDNFERAKVLYKRLSTLNIEITPKFTRKQVNGHEFFDYTDEQREWIKKGYYGKMKPFGINWQIPHNLHFDGQKMKFMNVLDEGLHQFNGWTCKAGLTRFFVDLNGDIRRCTKKVGGIIGNIYKDYELPTEPIVCDIQYCPCKPDAITEKWIDR